MDAPPRKQADKDWWNKGDIHVAWIDYDINGWQA